MYFAAHQLLKLVSLFNKKKRKMETYWKYEYGLGNKARKLVDNCTALFFQPESSKAKAGLCCLTFSICLPSELHHLLCFCWLKHLFQRASSFFIVFLRSFVVADSHQWPHPERRKWENIHILKQAISGDCWESIKGHWLVENWCPLSMK